MQNRTDHGLRALATSAIVKRYIFGYSTLVRVGSGYRDASNEVNFAIYPNKPDELVSSVSFIVQYASILNRDSSAPNDLVSLLDGKI